MNEEVLAFSSGLYSELYVSVGQSRALDTLYTVQLLMRFQKSISTRNHDDTKKRRRRQQGIATDTIRSRASNELIIASIQEALVNQPHQL